MNLEMSFCSFMLLSSFVMLGVDLFMDDIILPIDKESYAEVWELKNKGKLQSLIRDAVFPPPEQIMSKDYEIEGEEHGHVLRNLEKNRHRDALEKYREEGDHKHYTCLAVIKLQKRLKRLMRHLNKQQKFSNLYRLHLGKVSRQSKKLMRFINELDKHPENLKECIGREKEDRLSLSDISKLFDEYWNWRLEQSPEFATLVGNKEYNDALEDFIEERYEEDFKSCQEFKKTATKLLKIAKDPNDILNLKIFIAEITTFIEGYQFKGFYFPITNLNGIHDEFETLTQTTPVNLKDLDDILARFKAFPSYVNQTIKMMSIAMEKELTNHNVSMDGVVKTCRDYSSGSQEKSPFYTHFILAEEIVGNKAEGDRLKQEASKRIGKMIQPAFERLAEFLEKQYMPATRKEIAVSSLPNIGKPFYKACLKYHTSTDLTAEEIHNIGLKEVDRIEEDMKKIVKELGLKMSLNDFREKLKTDDDNSYTSAQEVLDHVTDLTNKVFTKLSKIFNDVKKTPLEIKQSRSPRMPPALYFAGTEDGTKNATLDINNHDYAGLPRYLMLSLVLHEAYPGHHLQSSYMLQRKDLPKFRKVIEDRKYSQAPSLFSMHTVFTEGWAMYCELLGHELGLYKDPMDRYGQLSGEIFRAGRLVVDTGIHAMGWSKDKAVKYLLDHSDFDKAFIEREVNRYITWPGQAVSYKIGQLEIKKLRDQAEQELGDKFDIKQFHDVILDAAGPLNILKKQVKRLIKRIQ